MTEKYFWGGYYLVEDLSRKSLTNNFLGYEILGYEILGYEFGWSHSFVCNTLENEFSKKLNINFNQYGLIDQYDLAIKASDFSNDPDMASMGNCGIRTLDFARMSLTIA